MNKARRVAILKHRRNRKKLELRRKAEAKAKKAEAKPKSAKQ